MYGILVCAAVVGEEVVCPLVEGEGLVSTAVEYTAVVVSSTLEDTAVELITAV